MENSFGNSAPTKPEARDHLSEVIATLDKRNELKAIVPLLMEVSRSDKAKKLLDYELNLTNRVWNDFADIDAAKLPQVTGLLQSFLQSIYGSRAEAKAQAQEIAAVL